MSTRKKVYKVSFGTNAPMSNILDYMKILTVQNLNIEEVTKEQTDESK